MAKFSITSAASNSVTKREKKTRATSSEPPQIAACKALRENCQTAGLLIIIFALLPGLNPAAGILYQLVDVLFHVLRIDIAWKSHHQIAEWVDDVNVVSR